MQTISNLKDDILCRLHQSTRPKPPMKWRGGADLAEGAMEVTSEKQLTVGLGNWGAQKWVGIYFDLVRLPPPYVPPNAKDIRTFLNGLPRKYWILSLTGKWLLWWVHLEFRGGVVFTFSFFFCLKVLNHASGPTSRPPSWLAKVIFERILSNRR